MRRLLTGILLLTATLAATELRAQLTREAPSAQQQVERRSGGRPTVPGGFQTGGEISENGDSTWRFSIAPIYVFSKPKDMRQYQRLVKNVKKVYPLAQEAKVYMYELETELAKLKTAREREAFTQKMEKEIVKKYTPVLKNMTFSQGKILIKLIDRETDQTPHAILREFRGKFTAGFWNSVAKIFKADLKAGYDPKGEDAMIEQIIIMLEAGLL